MARRVYINKPSGRGREFFGLLAALILIAASGFLIWKMFSNGNDDIPNPPVVVQTQAVESMSDGGAVVVLSNSFFSPPEDHLDALWGIVANCPYVRGKLQYLKTSQEVVYRCAMMSNAVNAVSYSLMEPSGSNSVVFTPHIDLYGGLVRFSRLGALALVVGREEGRNLLDKIALETGGYLSMEKALEISTKMGFPDVANDAVQIKAKSIADGMIVAALAHELGHLVCGHSIQLKKATVSAEMEQNEERQADAFSSSVIASAPFGEHLLEGVLLFHWISMLREESAPLGNGRVKKILDRYRTHPHAHERFENFVRQNSIMAEAFGFRQEGRTP